MSNVQHSALTTSNLHEPKAIAAADIDKVYVSDGAGSGAWQKIETDQLDAATITALTPGLVFISAQTASASSTIDFTGLSSTYARYLLLLDDIEPGTNSTNLLLRVGTGGTPTYVTSSVYQYMNLAYNADGTNVSVADGTAGTSINIGPAMRTNNSSHFSINISDPSSQNSITWTGGFLRVGDRFTMCTGAGLATTTGAITAVRLFMSSGTFSGTLRLYGYKKS